LSSAEVLAPDIQHHVTVAFLAAFSLELVLHSYRMHAKIKGPVSNHDLAALWGKAAGVAGSPFKVRPNWLDNLSHSHRNHLYRYRPGDLHGYATPPLEYLKDIRALIDAVASLVGNAPLGAIGRISLTGTGTAVLVSQAATMQGTGHVG
jgi:hypothetical protein